MPISGKLKRAIAEAVGRILSRYGWMLWHHIGFAANKLVVELANQIGKQLRDLFLKGGRVTLEKVIAVLDAFLREGVKKLEDYLKSELSAATAAERHARELAEKYSGDLAELSRYYSEYRHYMDVIEKAVRDLIARLHRLYRHAYFVTGREHLRVIAEVLREYGIPFEIRWKRDRDGWTRQHVFIILPTGEKVDIAGFYPDWFYHADIEAIARNVRGALEKAIHYYEWSAAVEDIRKRLWSMFGRYGPVGRYIVDAVTGIIARYALRLYKLGLPGSDVKKYVEKLGNMILGQLQRIKFLTPSMAKYLVEKWLPGLARALENAIRTR